MSTPVPVDVPAGFELAAQGCSMYTLAFHGATVGFISCVEGVYLVRRGAWLGNATFVGRFHGLRPALHALTDAPAHAPNR